MPPRPIRVGPTRAVGRETTHATQRHARSGPQPPHWRANRRLRDFRASGAPARKRLHTLARNCQSYADVRTSVTIEKGQSDVKEKL
ncbi:Protein of unknown function [Gryllus bimaculatus]|nr:Protein of unknown function [Gryllus bimaculatus]